MWLVFALVTAAFAGKTPAPQVVLKEKIDLNGDGKADKLQVATAAAQGDLKAVKVTIGSATLSDIQLYKSVEVAVVDVDSSDKSQQILVSGTSDSGKKWFTFFVFDGKSVVQALKVDTKSSEGVLSMPGGGDVIIAAPQQFWTRRTNYHLQGKGFTEQPQPYYLVDSHMTTTQPLELTQAQGAHQTVTQVAAGADLHILLASTDEKPSYLVAIPTGLVGWVDGATLTSATQTTAE